MDSGCRPRPRLIAPNKTVGSAVLSLSRYADRSAARGEVPDVPAAHVGGRAAACPLPPAPLWECLACLFLGNRGQPSAPGDLVLRLDLQSCLMEERLQTSAAVHAPQTQHVYQPVREGHVHQEKVSPRTQHPSDLP